MNTTNHHQTIFITGTDTDAGKTYVSELILQKAKRSGLTCLGFKPVSAGCESSPEGLRNADALKLMQSASMNVEYDLVNPVAYADPVAPHLAAIKQQDMINLDAINEAFSALKQKKANLLLVEGAGGWQLPLGKVIEHATLTEHTVFMPDFVMTHNIPVVLVVGMKLGCLNHALLTYQAIKQSGAACVGWVANQIDPHMDYYQENVATLTELIDVPCLAQVTHGHTLQNFEVDIVKLIAKLKAI